MMAGQSVWSKTDIARIGATLITLALSRDFAAGVAALCAAVGAPVRLPEREQTQVVVMIDEGREVTR